MGQLPFDFSPRLVVLGTSPARAELEGVYGDWLVVQEVEPKIEPTGTPQRQVLVRCKCGTEVVRYLSSLQRGKSKSCQPCAARKMHHKRRVDTEKRELDSIPAWLYHHARKGADQRSIGFHVTREELTELYQAQDQLCALSGVRLVVKPCHNRYGLRQSDTTASLDRIDSDGDYTLGNVQWVHKAVNMMKQGLSVEEFRQWCARVASHSQEVDTMGVVVPISTMRTGTT